jgi:hypothetical protein
MVWWSTPEGKKDFDKMLEDMRRFKKHIEKLNGN